MQPTRSSHPVPPGTKPPRTAPRFRQIRALSLVEVMCALFILGLVMLGLIGNFVQSRRVTESAVLHAAATSLVYGLIEQIKDLDYATMLPNYDDDPSVPVDATTHLPTVTPPYIRLRLNQEKVVWLKVVHTTPTDLDDSTPTLPPQGPSYTPGPDATVTGAIDNWIGSIPLSTTGSMSQQINLNIWVWIDDISNKGVWAAEGTAPIPDCSEVKKITIIYTYMYQDGNRTRTIRDREVILRTPYDQ